MLLDHYTYFFHKQLDTLIYLKKSKIMALMVEDKQLLENYKKIWEKIKKLMGIDFESKATYNGEYINTKIKTYKDSKLQTFTIKQDFKKCRKKKYHINVYQ